MKHSLFIVSILLGLSCSETQSENNKVKEPREIPSGGPCGYHYDTIPVEILEIYETGENESDLSIKRCYDLDDSTSCDTIYYYTLMNHKVNSSEIKSSNLKVGDQIMYVKGSIFEGHCNPENNYILLEKYKY